MRRVTLFEFEDQPWLPAWVRDAMTEHIAGVFRSSDVEPLHLAAAEQLARILARSGSSHIVDLCSGAGGPLPAILPHLSTRLGRRVTASLTDRFPNVDAARQWTKRDDGVTFVVESVNVLDAHPTMSGVRTMFNAIHHFRPHEVGGILRNATSGGDAIAIFEPFERKPGLAWRLARGGVFGGWRDASRAPDTATRAAALRFILPAVLGWDGAVSVMRSYRPHELLAIAERSDARPEIRWRAQQLPMPWGGLTVLIGEPSRVARKLTEMS